MISLEQLRDLALSLPDSSEQPHFEKISFRVKKKIFLTYSQKEQTAVVKLSPSDQLTYTADASIDPVNNKWGQQGWTVIDLAQVHPELFEAAVRASYAEVSTPKKK